MKGIKASRLMRVVPDRPSRLFNAVIALALLLSLSVPTVVFAQNPVNQASTPSATPASEFFRLERVPVEGGAELITIHGKLEGIDETNDSKWVPLVTVLRDTLGDLSPENDRLRYVWPLTYTRPTMRQRVTGSVPFLYSRVGNKKSSEKSPPPILDLGATDHDVWNKIFWTALQSLLLDSYGVPLKASTRSYRQNASDYRKSHIIRALSVLSLYQAVEGVPAFTETELSEIFGRLRLTDKTFGGLVGESHLQRYNERQIFELNDTRGHNWELLRQRAEAESLFFEPLQMPDGSTTHALLWVAKPDLDSNQGRRYDSRFLNIANPWSDKRLLTWEGYSEIRFLDSENRPVSSDSPGARSTELIPLALYGLDNPKIPSLLVDFRDGLNPKKREMSRRALEDVTRNVIAFSGFAEMSYFLGRTVFDLVTGRRGIDVNQPSRLRTYSQLKLLLSLNQSLDPELRNQIGRRLETVSLNPMENDLRAEAKLATEQYQSLLEYAKRPDGLPQKLARDRRAEMVSLEHGRTGKVFFRVANVLSFGKYVHREKAAPDLEARLDVSRKLAYHTRFLRESARSSTQIEVTANVDEVKRSLRYIADNASTAGSKSAIAAAEVFKNIRDQETRRFCLDTLSRMNNGKARSELMRLSKDKKLDQAGKDLIASFLKSPGLPAEALTVSTEKSSNGRVDQ